MQAICAEEIRTRIRRERVLSGVWILPRRYVEIVMIWAWENKREEPHVPIAGQKNITKYQQQYIVLLCVISYPFSCCFYYFVFFLFSFIAFIISIFPPFFTSEVDPAGWSRSSCEEIETTTTHCVCVCLSVHRLEVGNEDPVRRR